MICSGSAGDNPCQPSEIEPQFPRSLDKETCKRRRLIENYFGKLKENRSIAMRSCKTDQSFADVIWLAATMIQLR